MRDQELKNRVQKEVISWVKKKEQRIFEKIHVLGTLVYTHKYKDIHTVSLELFTLINLTNFVVLTSNRKR